MEEDGFCESNVLKKIVQRLEDQEETILLLQTELSFQKERVDKQAEAIKTLEAKVGELSLKQSGEKDGNNGESDIWKGTENLSLTEAVKETAEKAENTRKLMRTLGFVYDDKTKLYCNYSTGYYYDPTNELFYNGHTGIYYTYKADSQEYIFHSQIQLGAQTSKSKSNKNKTESRISKKVKKKNDENLERGRLEQSSKKKISEASEQIINENLEEEAEEGELSISENDDNGESLEQEESDCSDSEEDESTSDESSGDGEFPPSIRAIVLESGSHSIKKGSLFLVTFSGGSIGSKGSEHAITLPDDPSIAKNHANITYVRDNENHKVKRYLITDWGSETGTFLNGTKLEPHFPHEITHGSILKFGNFSLSAHIHPRTETCGNCEPGLLMESSESASGIYMTESMPKSRNAMMRQIKKKYGIDRPRVIEENEDYNDRAQERRMFTGSDNPYEKTQVVTAQESISNTNKGFKMLAKMGWSEGQTLGNAGDKGLLEPINPELRADRAGLGMSFETYPYQGGKSKPKKYNPSRKQQLRKNKPTKTEMLRKTMKRFREAEKKSDVKKEAKIVMKMDPG